MVTLAPEHLRFWGWQPLQLSGYVEWCGHRSSTTLVPLASGWIQKAPSRMDAGRRRG